MLRESSEGKFAFLHDHGVWGQCSSACGEYEVRRRREPSDPDGIQVTEVLVCDEHWIVHHLESPDLRRDSDRPRGHMFPTWPDGTLAENNVCYESCRSHLVPTTMEMRYGETQAYKDAMKEEE